MDDDGVFGPVGLLPDDVHKLQDALDGVDSGNAVIRPRGVVQMQDVLRLVRLRGRGTDGVMGSVYLRRRRRPAGEHSHIPA